MRWLTLSLQATISVSGRPIYRKKCRNIGWKMKQVLSDNVMKSYFMMLHNTEKTETRQWKCTTSLVRRQNHNGEVVDRNWLLFFSFTNIVSFVDWCARMRQNVRISLLKKEFSTGNTLMSAWGVTSNQRNI